MPIHSDAYLESLISDLEIDLSKKSRSIFGRLELAITAGTGVYALPDGVNEILEISWQGRYLSSMELEDYNSSSWYKPNNLASRKPRPDFFMLARYGYTTVQFHPIPHTSYALTNGNLLTRAGYNAAIVVSCYRVADTSNDEYRLRTRLLRSVIKYRAMQRAYLKAGKGQDMVAADFFEKKAQWIEQEFENIQNMIPRSVLNGEDENSPNGRGKVPRPTLPTTGNWAY